MRVRALVFDFDGLILDTESSAYESAREMFEEHGVALALEDWQEIVGTAERLHWLDWLERDLGRAVPDRDAALARRQARHATLTAAKEVRPGVREILVAARKANVAVTVASSSSRSWVEDHLRRLGLVEYFHAIRGKEDVEQTKPAPDVFLAALQAVGVEAAHAVAFEDSRHGATAAKAAGIYTVVVPNDITRTQSFDHADLVLESLVDVPIRTWLPRAI